MFKRHAGPTLSNNVLISPAFLALLMTSPASSRGQSKLGWKNYQANSAVQLREI